MANYLRILLLLGLIAAGIYFAADILRFTLTAAYNIFWKNALIWFAVCLAVLYALSHYTPRR